MSLQKLQPVRVYCPILYSKASDVIAEICSFALSNSNTVKFLRRLQKAAGCLGVLSNLQLLNAKQRDWNVSTIRGQWREAGGEGCAGKVVTSAR